MARQVKCRYAHCSHEDKLMNKENAICDNGAYYHEDCLNEKNEIAQIRQLCLENICSSVVYAQLNSVINSIVYSKHVSSSFLLYAIKYCIYGGIPIKTPQTLHYIVANQKIIEEWNKTKNSGIVKRSKSENEILIDNIHDFHYVPHKNKTLADLLGGK